MIQKKCKVPGPTPLVVYARVRAKYGRSFTGRGHAYLCVHCGWYHWTSEPRGTRYLRVTPAGLRAREKMLLE